MENFKPVFVRKEQREENKKSVEEWEKSEWREWDYEIWKKNEQFMSLPRWVEKKEERREEPSVEKHKRAWKVLKEEWDITEDTSKGELKHLEANIMFGKGHLGGLGQIESKKSSFKTYAEKSYEEMTYRDWLIFKEENDIVVKGKHCPAPFKDWENLPINTQVISALKSNYKKPTNIQS